jgi:microcystin-dependent protein
MKLRALPLLAGMLLGLTGPVIAEPAAPLIHHQGFLAAPDGGPLQGTRKLAFNLYDSPNAAAPIWGPQVFDGVTLIDGRYAVMLGTTDTAGRSLADAAGAKDQYLGITADGQEIQPRQQILASSAATAAVPPPGPQGAPAPSGGVPAGTIAAYWSNQVPDGWLLCDGSLVPEGAQYQRLRGLIGGNLPDLRGLFLRGIGQNSNPAFRYEGDATRTLWQFQQDELKSHAHKFDDYTFSANSGAGGTAWGSADKSDIDNAPGSPFSHGTAPAGGEETRPKNAAVYWIIKY